MPVRAKDIFSIIEEFAPLELAEEWDNSGLQLGDPDLEVERVLLALDSDENVALEAISQKAQAVICHHPLFFEPVKQLRTDQPYGSLVALFSRAGITVYAAHTNLDNAKRGVNDELARRLNLEKLRVLQPRCQQDFYKLVTFVPLSHAEKVRRALAGAGAGWIGNYSECTFQVQGKGTFRPLEGTNPFIGQMGKLECVDEIRLETILPSHLLDKTIKAMHQAHPYEEVAYDIYPLINKETPFGLGRIGELALPMSFASFIEYAKKSCGFNKLRYGGDLSRLIRRVAVCGGAGSELWPAAVKAGADVLITGDIGYHTAKNMVSAGLNFIDAGHYHTERIILPVIKHFLEERIRQNGWNIEILLSKSQADPFIFA